MHKILTLIMAIAAMPLSATAGPDRVSVLLGSRHFGATTAFQEINPGVFLTWERKLDWTVGVFRNSYGRGAIAGTAALPLIEEGKFSLDAFLGAAYYPKDGRNFAVHIGDIVPIGGLQARYGNMFMQVIPQDGRDASAVVSFGLTFGLGD